MTKLLVDLQIDWKDLRLIQNIYRRQHAAIQIENKVGQYHPAKERRETEMCVVSITCLPT